MKIIINNVPFDYDLGCKVLKLKYGKKVFNGLEDIWEDIVPITSKEIFKILNVEQRRVAIGALGIEEFINSIESKLVDKKVISKKTTWINEHGELETVNFDDVYELYVTNDISIGGVAYVKFKDTSTDRVYFIWVNPNSVFTTNNPDRKSWEFGNINNINAIQAIAWTIQTDVPIGNIEKIIRQGDCILVKPIDKNNILSRPRHLTENEYLNLLVAES